MAEPIVDFEHDGKTYTLMKFVQVRLRLVTRFVFERCGACCCPISSIDGCGPTAAIQRPPLTLTTRTYAILTQNKTTCTAVLCRRAQGREWGQVGAAVGRQGEWLCVSRAYIPRHIVHVNQRTHAHANIDMSCYLSSFIFTTTRRQAEEVFDWVLESDLDTEFDLLESEGLGE